MRSWEQARGDKIMPTEQDLSPDSLEEILDNCFIITLEGLNEGKYNYKFIGEKILEAYGSDATKRKDYERGNPLSYKGKVEHIVESLVPLIDEGKFTNYCGNIVKYRQCLVPISNDGKNVHSILGGMRFKIFPSENA